jgi:hypothetical protein
VSESKRENTIALPEGEYAEYLATLAANIADEKIRSREQKWRAIVSILITILAIFGFSNIFQIEKNLFSKMEFKLSTMLPIEVENYVERNREKILGDSLQKVNEEIESRIAFMQLYNISLELSEGVIKGDGFTFEQRDVALGLIDKVARNKKIVDSPEFSVPIGKIVDAFLRANESFYIDKIDKSLAPRITQSEGISYSMAEHYGTRITGAIEVNPREEKLFLKYALILTEAFQSPGMPAAFKMALNYKKEGNTKTKYGEGIIQDLKHSNQFDKEGFITTFDLYRSTEFYSEKTGENERIEELFKNTYLAYMDEIESLRETLAN